MRFAPALRNSPAAPDVTLVGFKKDHTSSYLDHFPGWQLQEVEPQVGHQRHATCAAIYFEATDMQPR